MSLSTIIANVILKLLKAFGIDPLLFQNKQASWNNETEKSKLTNCLTTAQQVDKKGQKVDKKVDNEVKGSPESFTKPEPKESKIDLEPDLSLHVGLPLGQSVLPPEATDSTHTDPWLKELSPDWDTHINK